MIPLDFCAYPEERLAGELIANPALIPYFSSYKKALATALCETVANIEFDQETDLPAGIPPRQLSFCKGFIASLNTFQDLVFYARQITPTRKSHQFFYYVLGMECLNPGILHYGFSSAENLLEFHHKSHSGKWLEFGILRRGALLLDGARSRQFELEQLIPLTMAGPFQHHSAVRGVSRSLAGSALDADQLTPQAKSRLLSIFPDDPYFLGKSEKHD